MTALILFAILSPVGLAIIAWEVSRAEKPKPPEPKPMTPDLLPPGFKLVPKANGRFNIALPCGEVLMLEEGWTVEEARKVCREVLRRQRRVESVEQTKCEGR